MLKELIFNKRILILNICILLISCEFGYTQKNNIAFDFGMPLNEQQLLINKSNYSLGLSCNRNIKNNIFCGIEYNYLRAKIFTASSDLKIFNRKLNVVSLTCAYQLNSKSKFHLYPVVKIGYAYVNYSSNSNSPGFSISEELLGLYNLNKRICFTAALGLNTILLFHPITLYSVNSTTEQIVNQFRFNVGIRYGF